MRFTGPRCAAVFIIQLVLIKSCSCIFQEIVQKVGAETIKAVAQKIAVEGVKAVVQKVGVEGVKAVVKKVGVESMKAVVQKVGIEGVDVVLKSYMINYRECKECKAECDAVGLDYRGLKRDMNTKLHGQHLVTQTVIKSIRTHTNDPDPRKALVLSFHGLTGVGKNFVTQIIRDNLYKKDASRHSYLYNSVIHFKDKSKVAEYKEQLHSLLYQNVKNCARSMFVFDEVDHMPTGLIDGLTPFLSPNTEIDGVDYRKTIFIFLSNTGGSEIMDIVFKHRQNGEERETLRHPEIQLALEESLELSEMQHALNTHNEKSGLKNSQLIHKYLIDVFVPFLPLERIHVRSCIVDLVRQKGYKGITEDIIEEVLDQIGWKPKAVKMFSKSGCKKIEHLVVQML